MIVPKIAPFRRRLDDKEEKIARALIRNPRLSDNAIGRMTGIPVMTVNRKRKKMEVEGLLSFYAAINMGPKGTGRFRARYLYLIRFKLGVSQNRIVREILGEPNVRTAFTEFIYEFHMAQINGHTALALIIQGRDDYEVNNVFNNRLVPSLQKNHGEDSIVEVSTIRLGRPIRLFHNYIPMVNMKGGRIRDDWADEAIVVE